MPVEGDAEADQPIPGARSPGRGGRRLTVLRLLDEVKEEWDRQKPLIEEAEERERIVLGEQWRGRDPMLERVVSSMYYGDTFTMENRLPALCDSWVARVNSGRLVAAAAPFDTDARDVEEAEAANKILRYHRQHNDEETLIGQAADLAQYHGDVLFLPMFDPSAGPRVVMRQKVDDFGPVYDPATKQPVMERAEEWGEVVERVVPSPDYCTSGEQDFERAQWLCVRWIIDQWTAQAKLEAAGFFGKAPEPRDFPTALDQTRRGVEVFELWLKPGPRSLLGCHAVVIDDRVVLVEPFPLKDKTQLPGWVWKLSEVRGLARGRTHLSNAIHQQRAINRVLRSIERRTEVAEAAALVGPSTVIDYMKDSRKSRVPNDGNDNLRERMGWFEGPGIPESLFKALAHHIQALHDTFGVSDATATGGDPTQTNSGEQLKTATALDSQKIRKARASLELARKRVAKQILELWQVHTDKPTLVRVIGADRSVAVDWIQGADIGGEVILEPRSGIYETALAGQAEAEQQMAAGQIDPQAGAERRRTGLRDTVHDAQLRAMVDQQAQMALKGQRLQPLPGADPQMARDRILLAIGAASARGAPPASLVPAQELADAYMAASMAGPSPNMQPAPQGKPDNGPGSMGPSPQRAAAAPMKPQGAVKETRLLTDQMKGLTQ